MALTIQNKDLNQNKQQPGAQQQQQPGQQPLPQQRQKGSGFTNTQKILGANVGNRLGQFVGQQVGQRTGQAQQQFQQGQQQFQQQAQAGRLDTEANRQARQNIMGRYGATAQVNVQNQPLTYSNVGMENDPNMKMTGKMVDITDATGRFLGQADEAMAPTIQEKVRQGQFKGQDLNQYGPTEQELQQFERFRSGTYGGPMEIQNAQALQEQAQDLGGISKGFSDAQSRVGLLQRFLNPTAYSQGQRTMDALLMGSRAQNPYFQQAARQANIAAGKIGSGVEASRLTGQNLAAQAKRFGEETTAKLGEEKKAINVALEEQAKKAETAREKRLGELKEAFKGQGNVELSADELKDLGLKEDSDVFAEYSDMLKASGLKATKQNVAALADYVKQNALSKLSGQKEGDVEFYDPVQAGSFERDKFDFDTAAAERLKQQKIDQAIEGMGNQLKWYLSAQRNQALNPLNMGASGLPFGLPEYFAASREHEARVAQEQAAQAAAQARAAGFQDINLGNIYGNLDVANTGDWYNRYEGEGAGTRDQRLREAFKTSRRLLAKK